MCPTGVGHFFNNVTLPVFPGAAFDRMVGVFGRPKAEAIVVFGRDDAHFEASGFERADPLFGVKFDGVENAWAFGAIAPFLVSVGIDGEVQESGGFQLLPGELGGAGFGQGLGE